MSEINSCYSYPTNLTIIELTMWPCEWQPTPRTAGVTVTKIAGYVCVRILMNRWFFCIFGIHTFYGTVTLLNIWICMQWTDAAVVVGADWTLYPWRPNSSNVGGVTAGQARHNSSNVGGVTAGQVRHNSSWYNRCLHKTMWNLNVLRKIKTDHTEKKKITN